MRISLIVVAALLAGACATAPHPETAVAFGWFGDLAGACWTGTTPDGNTLDTQCYAWQFGRFVRGGIHIVGALSEQADGDFAGDSVFAWDAGAKRIAYWFWGSDGSYDASYAYYEGSTLYFPAPGKKQARRAWTRIDADAFQVVREEKDGKRWKPTLTVTYRRKA